MGGEGRVVQQHGRQAVGRARPGRSLAGQVFTLQVLVVALLLGGLTVLAVLQQRHADQESAAARVLGVAQTVARMPQVLQGLDAPAPTPALQPLAEDVRRGTGVDFVVVMSPAGLRYTHPDPEQIGRQFLGHTREAVQGRPLTETFRGTLGPSTRAVVPVLDASGAVRGLVAVGITQRRVLAGLGDRLAGTGLVLAAALALAAAGSALVSRRLRRLTLGLGPSEITAMYEHHDAVLHAVREGLVVVDPHGRLVLANDEAVHLLGLPEPAGQDVHLLALPEDLRALLTDDGEVADELHVVGDRVLVVGRATARRAGALLGTVVTLRDHTALQALTGELTSVRGFAESLRAQAHEAANRLHTVVTMIELGRAEEAVRFATAELAASQELTDRLLAAVDEPVLAALLLGKAAEAHERGVELVVTPDTGLHGVAVDPRDLVTVLGNLVDNAVDAALAAPPPRRVEVTVRSEDATVVVRVADSGDGLAADRVEQAFTRGWSTKVGEAGAAPLHGRGLGLALVRAVVLRHGGTVTVDRADGAVFTVRLPLDAVPRQPVGAPA